MRLLTELNDVIHLPGFAVIFPLTVLKHIRSQRAAPCPISVFARGQSARAALRSCHAVRDTYQILSGANLCAPRRGPFAQNSTRPGDFRQQRNCFLA
ncbi:hypothetical protein EVAR_76640_1 [Eumeta japonica]|uniref:Uncharacterized protein n=1 Tax=Eumeta variegata TaxID=151549 RepID=A0A4C1T8D2_EUMVA|nr:hypothetical protein EVAR_76640_1 [Eumeta japonica]